jgi:thiamine-monophosphate kinase
VAVPESLRGRGLDPLELALHGGEDYQLLFTAARPIPSAHHGVTISQIGEIVPLKSIRHRLATSSGSNREAFIELIDPRGVAKPLIPGGWDHFRKPATK